MEAKCSAYRQRASGYSDVSVCTHRILAMLNTLHTDPRQSISQDDSAQEQLRKVFREPLSGREVQVVFFTAGMLDFDRLTFFSPVACKVLQQICEVVG